MAKKGQIFKIIDEQLILKIVNGKRKEKCERKIDKQLPNVISNT